MFIQISEQPLFYRHVEEETLFNRMVANIQPDEYTHDDLVWRRAVLSLYNQVVSKLQIQFRICQGRWDRTASLTKAFLEYEEMYRNQILELPTNYIHCYIGIFLDNFWKESLKSRNEEKKQVA